MSALPSFATLFSGGELAGVGIRAAGLRPIWGIENNLEIAAVATANSFLPRYMNILDAHPTDFKRPDALHASPPCTSASNASQRVKGTKETELDIYFGEKVSDFISYLKPTIFTLENVWLYRNFEAFKLICETLEECGYNWSYQQVNAADYGTIVLCPLHDMPYQAEIANYAGKNFHRVTAPDIVASLVTMPLDDQAHHLAWDAAENLVRAILLDTAVGAVWRELVSGDKNRALIRIGRVVELLTNEGMSGLESMEDIDESIALLLRLCLAMPLIRTKLSIIKTETIQITLLKILSCMKATVSTSNSTTPTDRSLADGVQVISGSPCPLCRFKSVPQTRRRLILRAIRGRLIPPLPAPTPWIGWYQSIEDLIPSLPESEFAPWQIARLPDDIRQSVLVDGQNAHVNTGVPTLRYSDQPAFTISAGDRRAVTRALLLFGSGNTNFHDAKPGGGVRYADEPAHTVSSDGGGRVSRAWIDTGRVVTMTPRALARFQSVPDSYWLPDKVDLARRIVGNGVSCLMIQRIYEGLVPSSALL